MAMRPQTVFNKVQAHLLTQGKRCQNESDECLYHGPNGMKCAVGALIPKKMYDPRMENNNVNGLFELAPEFAVLVGEDNLDLLESLQGVHDTVHPSRWRSELRAVAQRYKVKYTPFKKEA